MKKKQKIKYLIAIYSIVASLAVILWLLAYFTSNSIFQATSLNLATELLGVVFIFFIVNYLFSLDDWDTSERIDRLLEKLENEKTSKAEDFFIKRPSIDDLIKGSKVIDLCGVALGTTIDSHLSLIRDAIRRGANIRVLIMEKRDPALEVAASRSESDERKYYEQKLTATINNLEFLHANSLAVSQEFKGSLDVGFLSYPPSFGIKLFSKSDNESICLIEMFAHHVGWGEPPNFILHSNIDKEWFAYFQNQFEAMWRNSKKYNFTDQFVANTNN
jgi:hypothetical protein